MGRALTDWQDKPDDATPLGPEERDGLIRPTSPCAGN